jgi:DNA-binding protein HU-beta
MTKTELQIALAEATQTNKRTAALFLDTLSSLAYKAIRKEGEFVLPGFGKLVKQKRKARSGINPKTQQKIKIPVSDEQLNELDRRFEEYQRDPDKVVTREELRAHLLSTRE